MTMCQHCSPRKPTPMPRPFPMTTCQQHMLHIHCLKTPQQSTTTFPQSKQHMLDLMRPHSEMSTSPLRNTDMHSRQKRRRQTTTTPPDTQGTLNCCLPQTHLRTYPVYTECKTTTTYLRQQSTTTLACKHCTDLLTPLKLTTMFQQHRAGTKKWMKLLQR